MIKFDDVALMRAMTSETAAEQRAAVDMKVLEDRIDLISSTTLVYIGAFDRMKSDSKVHPLTAFLEAADDEIAKGWSPNPTTLMTLLATWRKLCHTSGK